MSTLSDGHRAEQRAASWLENGGFVIVEQNVHARFGEIDLVAWEGEVLCFVEVRMRRSARFGRPAATVGPRKQRRVEAAALHYVSRMKPPLPACRFDVVEVLGEQPGEKFRLLRGAFEAAA